MRKCLPAVLGISIVLSLGGPVLADLIGGTYTHVAVPASGWPGAPAYVSLVNALSGTPTAKAMPTPADTNSDGVTHSTLSEIFTPASTFTLGSIAVVASGGTPANNQLNMRLYTLSSGGGTNFPSGQPNNGDNFYFAGTELLGTSGSGLFFNFPGFIGQQVVTFDLSNGPNSNDQVTLNAGQKYALEIWQSVTTPGLFNWGRAGVSPFDAGGQMMGTTDSDDFSHSRTSLAALGLAGGPRTGALALYAVPEPGSACMVGLLGVVTLTRRRRL